MGRIPAVTVDQMREIDRLMVEKIGISILMMMENASINIAGLARKIFSGSVKNKKIVILCGKGNNGGDGLGAARHLINFGGKITCVLAEKKENLAENAQVQFNILINTGADIIEFSNEQINLIQEKINDSDLIIDALLGYNLKGNPRVPYSDLIDISNNSGKLIFAVDIPSGLNGDSGDANNPTIRASTTITLALPKVGLLVDKAKDYVGQLYVADLSIPKQVYEKLGINIEHLFTKEGTIKL